ncbi:MAG: hypothetical protein BGO29_10765 [Bacteroidales bacterium 36-12]|nr:MAG: hypothetical protein BGO29_10765 [Bacteroidales bacterium 36-12]
MDGTDGALLYDKLSCNQYIMFNDKILLITGGKLKGWDANIMIYANHMLRTTYPDDIHKSLEQIQEYLKTNDITKIKY